MQTTPSIAADPACVIPCDGPRASNRGWLAAAVLLVGCSSGSHADGDATDDAATEAGDADETTGDDDGGSSETGEPADDACEPTTPEVATVRALNRREYVNTVRDLLRIDASTATEVAAGFPPDAIVGFDNHADSLVASDLLVEQQFYAAEDLSLAVDLTAVMPCDPATGEVECAAATVDELGGRAYRRPLTDGERAALQSIYDDARSNGRDFDTAIRMLIQGMLLSPQFLYRAETGVADDEGVIEVEGHELASRLSYFLWASMPDDALFEAAASGDLGSTDAIEQQARRMLDDPRARETLTEFHRQWFELYRLPTYAADEALAPGFAATRDALLAETLAFVDHVLWNGDARADSLLVSDEIMLNDATAAWYGLAGAYTGGFEAAPATDERFGLLSQAGVLAQFSNTDRTSPTRRGRFVRDQLLCQSPPPPPGDVPPLPTEFDADATVRERLAEHLSNPACAGCHQQIDPIGFGLEGYDLAGRSRTEENGTAIDVSGELLGADVEPATFSGARELSERLVASPVYEACVATQVFEFAVGRPPMAADDCTLESLATVMQDNDGDMRELVIAIATSRAFRQRLQEVAP